MLAASVMLMAAALTGQQTSELPLSLERGELAACAPRTLADAEQCLRDSLSTGDLAILEQRIPARRFRPDLDMEISRAWNLADPKSPMGAVMDGLLGMHQPDVAAGMIISDLQARAAGTPLDFVAIAEGFRKNPVPDAAPGVPVTLTAPHSENINGN